MRSWWAWIGAGGGSCRIGGIFLVVEVYLYLNLIGLFLM